MPQAEALAIAIEAQANEWNDVVKIGRTHLQDAPRSAFVERKFDDLISHHVGDPVPYAIRPGRAIA